MNSIGKWRKQSTQTRRALFANDSIGRHQAIRKKQAEVKMQAEAEEQVEAKERLSYVFK